MQPHLPHPTAACSAKPASAKPANAKPADMLPHATPGAPMPRRAFVHMACLACLGVAAGATLLQSCGAGLPVLRLNAEANVLHTTAALAFAKNPSMALLRASELDFDVLLFKDAQAGNALKAVLMKCSHQDNPLGANANGLYCNTHGSRFGFDGRPTVGPANTPLTFYKVVQTGDAIAIYLTA